MQTALRWLPFLCVVLLATHAWAAGADLESGHAFVENFSMREYHADNQVWSATQDADGVLYFGNNGVILEFDGVSWRKIFVSDDNYVIRGLAFDATSSTVFVGGLNRLGFLRTGGDGNEAFVSLADHLSPADREFGSIYRVYATGGGIFFAAAKQVMRWRSGAFTVWKFPVPDRLQSACIAGTVYVQSPGLGLQRLAGEQFVPASDDPFFRTATLSEIVAGPDGSLVVATRHDGIFTFKDGKLAPLGSGFDAFFKQKEVRHLLRLRDGSLAVATSTAGVVLLDADNRFKDRWDEASGLHNQIALDLFEDREEGVWLCLYAGISRVQTRSPLSIFDPGNGLRRTSVHDLQRYHGTLYVGSDTGLYRLAPADPAQGQMARFEHVPGMDGDYWALCATDHGLLAVGVGSIYQFDDASGTAPLIDKFTYSGALMTPSAHRPGRVFFGTRTELRSLRFDETAKQWVDEGAVPGVAGEIHFLAEAPDGDWWVGTIEHGLFRVKFAPDGAAGQRGAASVTAFADQPGPLKGVIQVGVSVLPSSDVLAFTGKGLWRFDAAAQAFQPATGYGAQFADGSFGVDRLVPDARRGVWVVGRSTRAPWLDQQGGWADAGWFEPFPHAVFDRLNALDRIFPEENGMTWLASPDGIVRLDAPERQRRRSEKPVEFVTLIRRATASVHTATTAPATLALPANGARLDAAHNSVQFALAANTHAPGADVLYQTRLQGFGNGQWTAPNADAHVEFTNLSAGRYVFEARAQNADGALARTASVAFAVEPPWQRTGWAYAVYTALAALAIIGLVRLRLGALHAANARLEALIGVRTDELRNHQVELERARDAADATNRAKSAFLANMSHELRTPLNAVLGYTQIMLKDADLSARNHERLTVVGQSANHLLAMINEVLDISKIEAGKMTVDPVNFSLGALIDEVCAAFAPRFVEKELRFDRVHEGCEPGAVRGDAGKLRQVLFNLLGNAAKFTTQGAVRLFVRGEENDRWRFEVADTGVGIAGDELKSLFVAFHQGSAGRMSSQGTGLGLAISHRLVEALGGQLHVESSVGQGSQFWFELHLPAVASEDAAAPALLRTSRERRKIKGFRGPARRLLLADDEPINRNILREILEPLGFEIEETSDGVGALEACARRLPDALLLDLRMEPLDGYAVARTLRKEEGGKEVKIIAISASVFESDRQHAIDAGCDDFLPKPFEEEQLFATLGRLLALEWVFDAPPAPAPLPASGPAFENDNPPPDAEIDAMLELSRRGDIRGIKKRLTALLNADGQDYAGFVRRLGPMVAGYQMDRIRDFLTQCKNHANVHDD